ncbi:hypothetical protein ApAK_01325 [Thermoplasmatales archaeon AK]|nr:hypothetical protein [Thermoplasmatales archaeon AK]
MPRLGVYSSDFKLYHDIIELLKQWGLPFTSIEDPSVVPPDVSAVICSPNDLPLFPNGISSNTPLGALRKSLARLVSKDRFGEVVIGIDPGPYPGIAVFADGILTEAYECPFLERLQADIEGILTGYSSEKFAIRVGDGDKPNRDQIVRMLNAFDVPHSIVSEKNTSFPHKLHNNALSAARIASQSSFKTDYQYFKGRKHAIDREFQTLRKILS